MSVDSADGNTNWNVSLSNDQICKEGYAHKYYVVQGL